MKLHTISNPIARELVRLTNDTFLLITKKYQKKEIWTANISKPRS